MDDYTDTQIHTQILLCVSGQVCTSVWEGMNM